MEAEFRARIREYLAESERKIVVAWASLSTEQVWSRPNEHCLAPANQLIHLTGNLRQWVLATLDGQPDRRRREAEFAARSGPAPEVLLREFRGVLAEVYRVLASAPLAGARPLIVQGHTTSPIGVWVHVVEHVSYHTGQLLYSAKAMLDRGFDFYDGWDLDATAESAAISPVPPPLPHGGSRLQAAVDTYAGLLAVGRYLEAMERFYAEDVVQVDNGAAPVHGRAALLAAERAAERRVASARIRVCDVVVDETRGLVWGEMDIAFVSRQGLEQRLREAFRQRWRAGQIAEQEFWSRGFEGA